MLRVKDISITFDNKKVLNDINIEFANGTSTAIIGESGSGKTTLAKIIVGIEKSNTGKILLDNKELSILKKRNFDVCSKIQYIFQDPYSALENNFTIKQTLNEVVNMCKRHKHEYLDIISALSYVDKTMLDYMERKVAILSGGQRQKLCIARALIAIPEVIIADECTSMLDKESSIEIFKLLNKIKLDKNVCIIAILHNIDFLSDNWDKVAVFHNGEIVEYMDFKEFYKNCAHEYSKKMISAYNYFN